MDVQRNPLTGQVIECAIDVHRALGPGLLESAYDRCLTHELATRGIAFVRQAAVPIVYKGVSFGCGYRVDFLIERELILEIKSVDNVLPIHHAQIITYLKLLGVRQGLLINFNAHTVMRGLKSFLLDPDPPILDGAS